MSVSKLRQKESTRLAGSFLPGSVTSLLLGPSSKFHGSRLPCAAAGGNGSRSSSWKKQPLRWLMKHRATAALQADDHICDFLLLDCFVFLQRDRERAAFDRSSAVAAKCETSRTSSLEVESLAKTSGTVARDRLALHECSRYRRSALADAPTGWIVRIRWIFLCVGDRASGLSIFALSSSEIAFPEISLSRFGSACWRARIRVDPVLTTARTRCVAGPTAAAGSRGETCSAFCRARRAKADHNAKCAGRFSHRNRARDDSQRVCLSR